MGWLGDVVGGLFQPIVSGLGIAADWYQTNRQFKYDQKLQQTIFDREDNATVRRAEDLQAAGLSKTLAAGNAAGVGQAIRAQVPGAGLGNRAAEAIMLNSALLKQKADISRTEEERKLIEMQREKMAYELAPLKNLIDGSNATPGRKFMFNPESRGLEQIGIGTTNRVLDMMSKMIFDNSYAQYKANDYLADTSLFNSQLAQENALSAKTKRMLGEWDKTLTQKYGVRSNDKVDAIWEVVARDLGVGKDGTPYASAAKQILGSIMNVIAGIK